MPKSILIFSLAYYPRFVSGAEAAVKEITERIDPGAIEFHMVTLRFDSNLPKVEQVGNVLVHRIGITIKDPVFDDLSAYPLKLNKYLFQFHAAFKALSLFKKYRYNAIWAIMAHSSGVPSAIFKILKPKVPLVLTLQEGDPIPYIEKTMKPLWPLFKRAFTKASAVQAISGFLGDWSRERGFSGPLEIIPNAGNPGDFNDIPEDDLLDVRNKTGKKAEHIDLVTASRLATKNGVDDVIRSLPLLPEDVRFIVIGGGPDEQMLKNLVKELKVESRVIFIGQIDRTEVPKYRRVADIFVRPSRSEGLGNAILSAMAARKPIIATQEGGIADFLFDAKRNPDKQTTGWAVDKDSPEQIAEAVKDIIANPDKVKQVVDNAYRMVKEDYNWDVIAKKMKEKVFDRIL